MRRSACCGLPLTSPRFDTDDVERIRSQIMSGLRRNTTNPDALAGGNFLELAFGDHPYGDPTHGKLESVPTIQTGDLRNYVRRVLARDNLKIAVVGDIEPTALAELLDQTFGGLPEKADLAPVADVIDAKPPQRAFVPLDVPQTVSCSAVPA